MFSALLSTVLFEKGSSSVNSTAACIHLKTHDWKCASKTLLCGGG